MCQFDTLLHCKMITTIALANTSITSYNYHVFFVVRTSIYLLTFIVFQILFPVRLLQNVEQAGYTEGLHRKCEGNRGVKDDSKYFGLSK